MKNRLSNWKAIVIRITGLHTQTWLWWEAGTPVGRNGARAGDKVVRGRALVAQFSATPCMTK